MSSLTGQIGLRMEGRSFIARSIECVTRSRTHHIVIAISETHVISAEPGGAVIRPMDYFPTITWSRFDYTDEQRFDMAFMAEALNGHPYNFAAFTLVGLQLITGVRMPDFLARAVSWSERMDCSQMADFLLGKVGIDLFSAHSGMVYPGMFEDYFVSQGWLTPAELITT